MIFRFKGVIFRSLPLVFGGVFADEKGEETEKNWEMMRLECQGERLVFVACGFIAVLSLGKRFEFLVRLVSFHFASSCRQPIKMLFFSENYKGTQ